MAVEGGCGVLTIWAKWPGGWWEHEEGTTWTGCGASRSRCVGRSGGGARGQRSDEVERDRRQHGERAAAAAVGAACRGRVRGDGAGRRVRRSQSADRHGQPYLVERRFPKASPDAAARPRRTRCCRHCSRHRRSTAAYAASIDGHSGRGRRAGQGGRQDGSRGDARRRGTTARCRSGARSGPAAWACGSRCPTRSNADVRPDRLGGEREAVPARGPVAVPHAGPIRSVAPNMRRITTRSSRLARSTGTRTADQTHAAAFWNTNPAANYNALARRFVDQFSLDVSDSARLFAMLDLSAADAIINTWNDKYHYNFWRPITAIQNDDDIGDGGRPDLDAVVQCLRCRWRPPGSEGRTLITPPYPDHVSGATAYASASMHAFASFFGTDAMSMPFYLTSSRFPTDPALPREQRFFTRFSDVTNEILEADLGRNPLPQRGRAGGGPRCRGRALHPQAPLRVPVETELWGGLRAAPRSTSRRDGSLVRRNGRPSPRSLADAAAFYPSATVDPCSVSSTRRGASQRSGLVRSPPGSKHS